MRIIKKVPAHMVESVWTKDNKFSLGDFYKTVADFIGVQYDEANTSFDCRHINVSPELQEEWIAGFKKRYPEMPINKLLIGLALGGPKATVDQDYRNFNKIGIDYAKKEFYMEPYYVEIENGFIKEVNDES